MLSYSCVEFFWRYLFNSIIIFSLHLYSFLYILLVHKGLLQQDNVKSNWSCTHWGDADAHVLSHCVCLRYRRSARLSHCGHAGHSLWQVRGQFFLFIQDINHKNVPHLSYTSLFTFWACTLVSWAVFCPQRLLPKLVSKCKMKLYPKGIKLNMKHSFQYLNQHPCFLVLYTLERIGSTGDLNQLTLTEVSAFNSMRVMISLQDPSCFGVRE